MCPLPREARKLLDLHICRVQGGSFLDSILMLTTKIINNTTMYVYYYRAQLTVCGICHVQSNADSANIDNIRDLCTSALFRKRSCIREL